MGYIKSILIAVIFIGSYTLSFGQQYWEIEKFGPDSASRMECVKNISLYAEYYDQDNYKDAWEPWLNVLNICPKASKNTYIRGERIVKHLIEQAEDKEKKHAYIDTLMKVYDLRIKHFGEKGYVLGKEGVALLKYKGNTLEGKKQAYKALNQSVKIKGAESPIPVMVNYMNVSNQLFQAQEIEKQTFFNDYENITAVFDEKIAAQSQDQQLKSAKSQIETIFRKSGAASCSDLVELYSPKFEKNPKDSALLTKIINILDNYGCTEETFYFKVGQNYFELNPTEDFAYTLAEAAKRENQYETAIKYYKETISLTEDKEQKSIYYVELGNLFYSEFDDLQQAKEYAKKAIETNNKNGAAYMLLGNIYASVENYGKNELEKKAIYWLAVDYYQKAKEADSSLEEKANKQINVYRKYFPSKSTVFFYGLEEGQAYELGSWINETTTVRFKNEG